MAVQKIICLLTYTCAYTYTYFISLYIKCIKDANGTDGERRQLERDNMKEGDFYYFSIIGNINCTAVQAVLYGVLQLYNALTLDRVINKMLEQIFAISIF